MECKVNDTLIPSTSVKGELEAMLDSLPDPSFSTEDTRDGDVALYLDMESNHSRKELTLIAGYYNIGHRRRSKLQIAYDIVAFETDPLNWLKVEERRVCWEAVEVIKNDPYMRKYLVTI